jgi:hypothetical protein
MMVTDVRAPTAQVDFRECESGAVTVDWVVLTAVVVVMFIFAAGPVFLAGEDLLQGSADEIASWSAVLFAN